MYLNSINFFRGIAVFFIVAGHCPRLADFTFQTIPEKTLWNLTVGGTAFFVFISGFLFHHVFYERFHYREFIGNKFKFLLTPYLVMSAIPIIYFVFIKETNNSYPSYYYTPSGDGWINGYAIPVLKYLFTGHSIGAFWYIPFILIVFLFSPLHSLFIKLRPRSQVTIASLWLLAALFVHRAISPGMLGVWQNVFTFMPVYLIGIICSEKKDFLYAKLRGKEFYLLAGVLLLAVVQAISGKFGNYRKPPFEYGGIDLQICQKVVFSIFLMVGLHRFELAPIKFLASIARNSFGIFFIHGVLIAAFIMAKRMLGISFPPNSWVVYLLVVIVIFALSMGLTVLARKIFPRHSRYLVGS